MRRAYLHTLCFFDFLARYLGIKTDRLHWADVELCAKYDDWHRPIVDVLLRLRPFFDRTPMYEGALPSAAWVACGWVLNSQGQRMHRRLHIRIPFLTPLQEVWGEGFGCKYLALCRPVVCWYFDWRMHLPRRSVAFFWHMEPVIRLEW